MSTRWYGGAWGAGRACYAAARLRAPHRRARRHDADSQSGTYGSLKPTRWDSVRSSSGASCSPTRLSGTAPSPSERAGTVSHSGLGGGPGVRRACRRALDRGSDRHRPRCLIGCRPDQGTAGPGAAGSRVGGVNQSSKSPSQVRLLGRYPSASVVGRSEDARVLAGHPTSSNHHKRCWFFAVATLHSTGRA